MSVKIGSVDSSDVFVGTASGKTNIDKIVVGNADGTGTTVWERSGGTGPWNSGRWIQGSLTEYTLNYLEWDESEGRFTGVIESVDELEVDAVLYFNSADGIWELQDSDGHYEYQSVSRTTETLRFRNVLSGSYQYLFWSAT